MSHLLEIYKNKGTLHHAYYFVENKIEEGVHKVKDFLENHLNFKTTGNPDFWHKKFSNFSIEDSRELIGLESRKDLGSGKKIFIIETEFITEEAQNSLLKVFEEPKKGTHFFIITNQDILLPTLRSRVLVVSNLSNENSLKTRILTSSLSEKLKMVKEIVDGIKDEEMSKQDAINFLNDLESELYAEGVEKNSQKLKICQNTRDYLLQRGAPVKMILENLVVNI